MRISDWSSDVCSSDLVDLNAFLHIDRDLTLAQADAADQQLAQGQAGPLTGIPIAHKDVFATQGWRTTAASKMLEHYTSPFDATVVARLQQAGALSIGQLNCDEFAMGSGNENRSEEHTSELQSLMSISYAAFCLRKQNYHKIQDI